VAVRADGTVTNLEGSPGLPQGVSNIIAVATGPSGSLGLKADGTVMGWGIFPPTPFPASSNIVEIAAGQYYFLALTADGRLLTGGAVGYTPPLFPCVLTNVFRLWADVISEFSIVLVGNGAPFVTVQPGNQFVNQGGTVWLHVRAVGVQPVNYQWQFNRTPLAGATNADLTISNLQPADFGNYQAVVSNSIGFGVSRVASIARPMPPSSPYTNGLGPALGATNLIWSTSGNVPWFAESAVTHDGVAAAQNGHIGDSQASALQTTVTGPGTLTFWWMVSSEQDFDFLNFWVNNTNLAAISGEVDWEQETFSLGAGSHVLKWIYLKDPDVSAGKDAGWLDQVVFTPTQAVSLGVPQFQLDGTLAFSAYAGNGVPIPLTNSDVLYFEASSNLIEWTPLTNSLVLSNGAVSVRDPDATNSPARFYRLIRQ